MCVFPFFGRELDGDSACHLGSIALLLYGDDDMWLCQCSGWLGVVPGGWMGDIAMNDVVEQSYVGREQQHTLVDSSRWGACMPRST